MQGSDNQKNNQKPQETIQKIEQGDLQLQTQIQNGILFLGETKVGKTTCCHYLLGHSLIGKQNDVKNIVYFLDRCDAKFKSARIGVRESDSQTQVPNLFKLKAANKELTLVDCPGYGDSNGCSFKISNGYFHYRVFSLVKNAKFVFVVDYGDLSGKAQKLKSAFLSLVSSFSYYEQIEADLLNATAFIITKVPKNLTKQDIQQRLTKLKNPFKSQRPAVQFKTFRQDMISKKKVFIIHKPDLNQVSQGCMDTLQQIQQKTTAWTCTGSKESSIHDMKYIKTSIKDDLISPKSQDELVESQQYLRSLQGIFRDKFFKQITIMEKIFKSFIEQVFQQQKQFKFLEHLRQSKRPQLFNENSIFTEKRNLIKKQLFMNNKKQSFSESPKQRNAPNWLKKIRIAQNLQRKSKQIPDNLYNSASLELLKQYSYQTFKQIIQLVSNKNDREVLIDFAYQILKILEISNVLYHIMEEKNNQSALYIKMLGFLISEYPAILQETFKGLFTGPFLLKKIQYVEKMNVIKNNSNPKQALQISDFFQKLSVQVETQENKNFLIYEKYDLEKISQIIKSVKKKSFQQQINSAYLQMQSLNKVVPDLTKLNIVTTNLTQILSRVEIQIKQTKRDVSSKQRLKFMKARCLSLIAKGLQLSSLKQQSLKVYDSFVDLHKVKQLFYEEQSIKIKDHEKKKISNQYFIKFYMQFITKMMRYNDMQTAKTIGYKVYHYAIQLGQMQQYFRIEKLMQKIYSIQKSDIDFLGQTKFLGGVNFDIGQPLTAEVYDIIHRRKSD